MSVVVVIEAMLLGQRDCHVAADKDGVLNCFVNICCRGKRKSSSVRKRNKNEKLCTVKNNIAENVAIFTVSKSTSVNVSYFWNVFWNCGNVVFNFVWHKVIK